MVLLRPLLLQTSTTMATTTLWLFHTQVQSLPWMARTEPLFGDRKSRVQNQAIALPLVILMMIKYQTFSPLSAKANGPTTSARFRLCSMVLMETLPIKIRLDVLAFHHRSYT